MEYIEGTGFVDRLSGTCATMEWWTADQPIFTSCEVWTMLALLGEGGLDPFKVLDIAQVDHGVLLDPSVRLSLRQYIELYGAIYDFGAGSLAVKLGKRLHLSTFGTPGFAVLSSPFLGHALRTLVRLAPMLNIKFPMRIKFPMHTEAAENIKIDIYKNREISLRENINLFGSDVLKVISFLRDILGREFEVKKVTIGGVAATTENLVCQFAGVDSSDSAIGLHARIELDAGLLSYPLSQSHPDSHRRAVNECDRLVNDLRARADLRIVILNRLRRLDVGIPTFADIADELNMSERTLRRRLEKSQTSYSRILDELREELAAEYLLESGQTTEDIAERLGYSDAANFRHAFKRWTGQPPSVFRAGRSKVGSAC